MNVTDELDKEFWDVVIQRLDPPQMNWEEIERELANASDEQLSADQIDAMVQAAIAEVKPAKIGTLVSMRKWRLLPTIAASILGLLLLTAGTILLWPNMRDSSKTLSYKDAIAISSSPWETNERRSFAIDRVFFCIQIGLEQLRMVAATPAGDPQLSRLAENYLRTMEPLFHGHEMIPPAPFDRTLEQLGALLDMQEPNSVRHAALDQIALMTSTGLITIRDFHSDSASAELEEELVQCRTRIEIELRKR